MRKAQVNNVGGSLYISFLNFAILLRIKTNVGCSMIDFGNSLKSICKCRNVQYIGFHPFNPIKKCIGFGREVPEYLTHLVEITGSPMDSSNSFLLLH